MLIFAFERYDKRAGPIPGTINPRIKKMVQAQKETIARAYEALENISAAGAEKGLIINCNITAENGLWASIDKPAWKMFTNPFLPALRTKSIAEVEQWEQSIIAEINSCAAELIEERVQALQAELAKLTR